MEDPAFVSLPAGRILLRRFRPADAEALAAYRNDPAVARYQGWKTPWPAEEATRFVASLAGLAPGTAGRWFQFAVGLAEDDALIGDCALHCTRDDPRQAELGCSFGRAHQGKGYAGEAVAALLAYAFTKLDLHRVFAFTDVRNAPARRLLERTGFRREGHLVESARSDGGWASEYLYAQLAAEWQAREARAGGTP